ncbi:MAG: hypothetical protein AAB355_00660 [Patescibacteria group bacterium]
MKKIIITLTFLAFFAGSALAQEEVKNAGFTPGNIWYSKDPFFAGDTVDIHTLVFNSNEGELSGVIEFYDGENILGKISVNVPSNGGFKDASISWRATEGYHKIFAVIKEPKITLRGASSKVSLGNGTTDASEKLVAAIAIGSIASSSKGYIEEKINLIKEYADKNLPEPVIKTANVIGLTLEEMRGKSKIWADNKGIEAREVLAEFEKNGVVSTVKKPLYYAYAFISDAVSYFFGNKYLFYGGFIVFVFLFLRFVKRSLFFEN